MKIKEIISRSNPDFRKFLGILKGQGVKKQELTLLSGRKQVREVLRELPDRCEGVIVRRGRPVPGEAIPQDGRIYALSPDLFRELDLYGTDQPILLVRTGVLPLWNKQARPPGCTLFVPFQDPVNVGAVIRSAAAFGVPRVVMLRESAHPLHHKSGRVAGSAVFRVPIFEGPSIMDLAHIDFPLITLSPDGEDIRTFKFPTAFGLLPGLEGPGLPPELKGRACLAIPMARGVESLNAALATGIALYEWRSGQS